jgi:hypothetical protein
MPRPQTQEELLAAGYVFLHGCKCPDCGELVEHYRTPDGRMIRMQPMGLLTSKPELHKCSPPPKTYGTDKIPQAKPLSVEEAQSLAFTPGAWKHVSRPADVPPPEAIWNLQHRWWNWLDKSEPLSKVASLKEAIP